MLHHMTKLRHRLSTALRDDTGASTAEYAITVLATYIAPGRTYFTLAGVPVRTG